MKLRFTRSLLLLGITIMFYTSCNTKTTPEPVPGKKTMKNLVVSDNFNWSTSNNAQLSITAKDNQGSPIQGAKFSIYSTDPAEGGNLIASGITNSSGTYSLSHIIPSYYTSLYVQSDYVGLPTPGQVTLTNNSLNLVLGGKQEKSSRLKTTLKATSTIPKVTFLGNYNSEGVPDYLEPNNDIIDRQLLNDINNTLPERSKLPQKHPEYFSSNFDPNLHLNDACDVWVTFVSEGAGYKNVLGFYTYPTNNPPQTPKDIDSITIIFPNVSFAGSGGGLHSGNKVNIGRFPAHTSIGFVLLADGWKNKQVTKGKWALYSQSILNPESNPSLRQHCVLLSDNARDLFLLGFEDIRRDYSSCDNDFNDAVFYIKANPIQAVNQSNLPPIDYQGTDSDGDGVPDHFDNYPNNPDKAFNNYYFQKNNFGTLAFEDLWPYTGDYDFNDAVIDYNFNQITNGENKVVSIEGTFVLRAQGAYFHNGFGFQLPIDPSLVSSVTGDINVPGKIVHLNNKNLEANQSKAVVIMWEDGFDVLPNPGQGIGVNTTPGASYVTPDTLHVTINFNQPISLSILGNPPYNPFIFTDGNRGTEIHLPNKLPTDLADPSQFGTGADDSKPQEGRYYKTANNLPWAINVIEKFDYPKEKVDITQTYNHFADWAESSGISYPDWYKDKSGYRTIDNIFVKP